MTTRQISSLELALLTLATAVVTANGYYIHPIIARIAEDFEVSASSIGLVPALNQLALAVGIFLLLPLGDRFSNRRLISFFVAGQCAGITMMAFAPDVYWFATGSTLLGFFTIAPYLLPSYVSKRVDPGQLGHATAMLTTGVLMGILLARSGAGVIGEYLGWRTVYYLAAALMLITGFLLPLTMDDDENTGKTQQPFNYPALLLSMGSVIARNPEVLLSGAIQGLSFGLFLAIWLALGLHLTSPAMGYGVDVVGYLSLLAIVNLYATPRLGRLADRIGARRARLAFAVLQAVGMWLLFPFGDNIWLLMIPLLIMNIVGPTLDVSCRMLFLSEEPAIRTRLMAVYIILMFLGGGTGSWLGTTAYGWGGWQAVAWLASGMTAITVLLSLYAMRRYAP
jgi:predicted MFS family arabinose efflux permease